MFDFKHYMSGPVYNMYFGTEDTDSIEHSRKGQTWKKHKYIKKVNGRYIYPTSSSSKSKRKVYRLSTNTEEREPKMGEAGWYEYQKKKMQEDYDKTAKENDDWFESLKKTTDDEDFEEKVNKMHEKYEKSSKESRKNMHEDYEKSAKKMQKDYEESVKKTDKETNDWFETESKKMKEEYNEKSELNKLEREKQYLQAILNDAQSAHLNGVGTLLAALSPTYRLYAKLTIEQMKDRAEKDFNAWVKNNVKRYRELKNKYS